MLGRVQRPGGYACAMIGDDVAALQRQVTAPGAVASEGEPVDRAGGAVPADDDGRGGRR